MKKLLVCIAAHYNPDRLKHLYAVLKNLGKYECVVDVIIHTNSDELSYEFLSNLLTSESFGLNSLEVSTNDLLVHPFHLTWLHRKYISDNIENYDCFIYVEDDELIPWDNFKNYLDRFEELWSEYVPSFVRIEYNAAGEAMVSDTPHQIRLNEHNTYEIKGRHYAALPFPVNYHGFWIMPQKALKESMKEDFVKLSEGREFAASYTAWELGKRALLEIHKVEDKWLIKESCFSYHLPNNYAISEGSPNGKISPLNLFV